MNEIPSRMFYAGRRWRVTDTPTRLRGSIWTATLEQPAALYGWRFQATSDAGDVVVFDVYREEHGWHVHHTYT